MGNPTVIAVFALYLSHNCLTEPNNLQKYYAQKENFKAWSL